MEQTLQRFLREAGPRHWSRAARKDPEFLGWVIEQTADMAETTTFPERVYAAISGTRPLCPLGRTRTLRSITEGWKFCGTAGKCPCAAAQVSESCKRRIAARTDAEQEAINIKREETFRTLHGVTNAGRLPQAIAAHDAFYADPARVAGAVEKGRRSMLEAYGVPNAFNLPEVNEQRRTLAQRLAPEAQANRARLRREQVKAGCLLDLSYQRLSTKFSDMGFALLTPRGDYVGVGGKGNRVRYQFSCARCDTEFSDYIYDGFLPACPSCDAVRPRYVSREEDAVAAYMESLGAKVIRTSRRIIPGIELDIILPDHQLAIEYCGLYWHSEYSNGKTREHHLNKLRLCEARGWRLITMFSDEWMYRRDICRARLAHAVGCGGDRLHARKTAIRPMTRAQAAAFLETHHIQGSAPGSTVHLGLFHNDSPVCVMTFGPLRRMHNHVAQPGAWELYRLASSQPVVGGASKLFKSFVREWRPESVLSFCDRRWGTGRVYEQMGFAPNGETSPGYAWVERYNVRHHRTNFTKHKLVRAGFDASKSEQEIMCERGFDRIWDCGNLRFRWTPPCQS